MLSILFTFRINIIFFTTKATNNITDIGWGLPVMKKKEEKI